MERGRNTHDREFLLNGHDDLNGVERIQAEVGGERGGARNLSSLHGRVKADWRMSVCSARFPSCGLRRRQSRCTRLPRRSQREACGRYVRSKTAAAQEREAGTHLAGVDLLEGLEHVDDARLDVGLGEASGRSVEAHGGEARGDRSSAGDGRSAGEGQGSAGAHERGSSSSEGGDHCDDVVSCFETKVSRRCAVVVMVVEEVVIRTAMATSPKIGIAQAMFQSSCRSDNVRTASLDRAESRFAKGRSPPTYSKLIDPF